jgi:hypothetical protein
MPLPLFLGGFMRLGILIAFVLAGCLCVVPPRAEAQTSDLAWNACSHLLSGAAKIVLARLKVKLPPEEYEGIAELACETAELYQDVTRNSPPAQQPTTADPEAIFCEKSSFSFCKDKTQQGPMGEQLPSFRDAIRQSTQRRFAEGWAYDCHRRRLTPEQCATAVLQGAE